MDLRCVFGHKWAALPCSTACRRCGAIKVAAHQWADCVCRLCGATDHQLNEYGCVKCGKFHCQLRWTPAPAPDQD